MQRTGPTIARRLPVAAALMPRCTRMALSGLLARALGMQRAGACACKGGVARGEPGHVPLAGGATLAALCHPLQPSAQAPGTLLSCRVPGLLATCVQACLASQGKCRSPWGCASRVPTPPAVRGPADSKWCTVPRSTGGWPTLLERTECECGPVARPTSPPGEAACGWRMLLVSRPPR